MATSARALRTLARGLRESKFVTLVMGASGSGKTTTVNALLGTSRLPTRPSAVMSRVSYGEDEETVTVFHDNARPPRQIDSTQFLEEFTPNDDEMSLLRKGTNTTLERLIGISHVRLSCKSPLIRDGVEPVDSPGLGTSIRSDKLTRQLMGRAHAMVLVLDARFPFDDEVSRLLSLLARRSRKVSKNVFFLVNKMDLMEMGFHAAVTETAEYNLRDVFTRDGSFDEDLMRRRVFYVDAKGALESRETPVPATSDYVSSFLAFEEELERYLTSNERVMHLYRPSMFAMAVTRNQVREYGERTRLTFAATPQDLDTRARRCSLELDGLQGDIDRMCREIGLTRDAVMRKVTDSLRILVSKHLPAAWPDSEACYYAWLRIREWERNPHLWTYERKVEHLMPVAGHLRTFVEQMVEDWFLRRLDALMEDDLEALQETLEGQDIEFGRRLQGVMDTFTGGRDDRWMGNPIPLRLAPYLIQTDAGTSLTTSDTRGLSSEELLVDYLRQEVTCALRFDAFGEFFLGSVVKYTVFNIPLLLQRSTSEEELLKGLPRYTFYGIQRLLFDQSFLRRAIRAPFAEVEAAQRSAYLGQIEDERTRQMAIIGKGGLTEDERGRELLRMDEVVEALSERTGHVLHMISYHRPSETSS